MNSDWFDYFFIPIIEILGKFLFDVTKITTRIINLGYNASKLWKGGRWRMEKHVCI